MGPPRRFKVCEHGHRAVCGGGHFEVMVLRSMFDVEGGWLARHGTSIRWARLIARMFGHGHRAMCSGGCQFEVLEEHVRACVPAYKTRQTRQARKALEPEGVGGASEGVGGR